VLCLPGRTPGSGCTKLRPHPRHKYRRQLITSVRNIGNNEITYVVSVWVDGKGYVDYIIPERALDKPES